MYRYPRIFSIIAILLLVSAQPVFGSSDEKAPATLPKRVKVPCKYTVNSFEEQALGQEALLGRLAVLTRNMTPHSPDISPNQMIMVGTLADYSNTGLTAEELTAVLHVEQRATFKDKNVYDSLSAMERGRRLIFGHYGDHEPKFLARAEGLFEILNAIRFYRQVSRFANAVHYGRERVALDVIHIQSSFP